MSEHLDRLEIEALREAAHKSEVKAVLKMNEGFDEGVKRCDEIWNKDFDILVLSLRKAIADKVPDGLRYLIIRKCVHDVVALLTPVETAGILMSIITEMFERRTPPVMVVGGSASLEEIFGVKDSGNGKPTSVV